MDKDINHSILQKLLDDLRKNFGDDGVRLVIDNLAENERHLVSDKEHLSKTVPFQEYHLLKRIFRWVLKAGIQGVVAEYETTAKERDALIDNLTQSEEKYRTVLVASPDPVVVYDQEGKVIYFNPAFTRVFGWTIEERLGKKMSLFVPEANWKETQMMIDKVRAGENFSGIETRRLTKAGKMIDVSISGAVYKDSDGNPMGSVINLRDISIEKRLRAEAMRVGQLASLGELAAGVAHEINNPISGVIGYAEILKDRFEEQGQDADIPEKIIKEGERIAAIVRNLLSFARDRKEEYNPSSIRDILSETLGLIERRIIKDGIKFSLDIPTDLPPVNVRSKEIQHVFLNIINNARYALNRRFPKSSEDKFLEIKSKLIKDKEHRYVRTTFFDGGTGIPDHILNRVSEPFFSTKPKDEGIGLGLSMSHGIIQDHGGKLILESKEGAYTKVMVDLPVILDSNLKNESDNDN